MGSEFLDLDGSRCWGIVPSVGHLSAIARRKTLMMIVVVVSIERSQFSEQHVHLVSRNYGTILLSSDHLFMNCGGIDWKCETLLQVEMEEHTDQGPQIGIVQSSRVDCATGCIELERACDSNCRLVS